MEPVSIDIDTATTPQLRAECVRLGHRIAPTARATTLVKLLKTHTRRYQDQQNLLRLAVLLFGEDDQLDETDDKTVFDGINLRLYRRMVMEDRVGKQLITDPTNDQQFVVTGMHNAANVTTQMLDAGNKSAATSGTRSILLVARLVFPDVARLYEQWETDTKKK